MQGLLGALKENGCGRIFYLVSHLVQKHKNNCSRCSQMLGENMPVAYSRGRRSGGYANWLTCQWHVNGSSEPLAKNSPTDDNADDCISGNYYGYERGGTLV